MSGVHRHALALEALHRAHTRLARPADDRFVRLTRCQWSGRKRRAVDRYTTLYRFLAQMKEADPEAWAQVRAGGVRVDGRSVRLGGRPATGARLHKVLSNALLRPAVARFEAHEAARALQRMEDLVVTPGRWGRQLVGCGCAGTELRYGRVRVVLEPSGRMTTVGDLLDSPEALAIGARAALQAPDLMVAAVWSLTPCGRGSRPQVKDALATLTERIRGAVRAREIPGKDAPYTAQELVALGLEETCEELERMIWPAGGPVDASALAGRIAELTRLRRSPLQPRTQWSIAHAT